MDTLQSVLNGYAAGTDWSTLAVAEQELIIDLVEYNADVAAAQVVAENHFIGFMY